MLNLTNKIILFFLPYDSNTTLVNVKCHLILLTSPARAIQIQHLLMLNISLFEPIYIFTIFKYNTC